MAKQELKWIQSALLRVSTLSPQQQAVLRCLAAGMDNRSIAGIMGRSGSAARFIECTNGATGVAIEAAVAVAAPDVRRWQRRISSQHSC